jgi:hypothetical protein
VQCDRCGEQIPAGEETDHGGQMTLPQLERELATLRHMEKVRGQMRASRRIICL